LPTRKRYDGDDDARPQKFERKPLPTGLARSTHRAFLASDERLMKVAPRISAAEEVRLANVVQASLRALNASSAVLARLQPSRPEGKALSSPSFAQLARQLDLSRDAALQSTFHEGLRARDALVAANTGLVYKQVPC
jgi:hypothetical protein